MIYLGIAVTFILINNFILSQFLGLCPFIGVSKSSEAALGMGLAVTFVMTIASMVTFLLQYYVLNPLNLQYLQTVGFILVIASLVQLLEMIIQKVSPSLYKALGIFLPLITTNCAVLGIAILNINNGYNFLQSTVGGFSAGVGFTLAIVLMSNIREYVDQKPVAKAYKGVPIAFISAGLMALAFMAFDKALLTNLHLV